MDETHEQSKQTNSLALELDRGQGLPLQTPRKQGKTTETSKFQKIRLKRLEDRKACRLQVKRLQQYLRLTQPPVASTEPAVLEARDPSSSTNLEASMTSPDGYAVLVSVDCEAYEFAQQCITEIGISTLDTRDIIGVEPGPEGENWTCKITSRHFRTKEHKNKRNKRHVQDCPDNFSFGQSEWISQRDAAEVLRQCFRQHSTATDTGSSNPCKVIFIGHNAAADEIYLAQLGFDLSKEAVDVIDSEVMAMAVFREKFRSSLGKLLLRYGFNGQHFHNAGNDANYTLQLAILMALKEFRSKKTTAEWQVEQDMRVEGAIEKAKGKAVEELSNDLRGPVWEVERILKVEQACKDAVATVFADFEGWSTEEDDEVEGSATVPRSCAEVRAKVAENKRKKQARSEKKASAKRAKADKADPGSHNPPANPDAGPPRRRKRRHRAATSSHKVDAPRQNSDEDLP